LLVLFWFLFNPFKDTTQLAELRYLGPSAGRLMERHIGFYEGYEETGIIERALHTFLFGNRQQVEEDVLKAYEEVLEYLRQHPETTESWDILNTKARWLITIAELRSIDELEKALEQFKNNPEEEVIAAAVKYAYFENYEEYFSPEVYTGATMIPTGWAKDRLRLRINTRLNKPHFIELFSERLLTNGRELRQHVLEIAIAIAFVILVGLYSMFRYQIFYIKPPWNNDVLDNPWPLEEGIHVAVRAAVYGLLIWLGLHLLSSHYFKPNILTLWSTLFASLPMLWLIHHRLLKPRNLNFVSAFGLSLGEIKYRDFFALTSALLALELIGLLLIGWGTWKLGLGSHWAQGIQERLVFGPTQTVIFSVINILIWTAIFEEIGFRGLIYTSIRQRLTPTVAIVISAVLFSALHLKSINGFLSIFWSALILAYAYEKYRSILPGILIHSIGNLLYLSTVLLFYR
jgi:membrane protease YdiL (CAAX protease family)